MQHLQTFQQREHLFRQTTAKWQKQYNQVSWVRVIIFLISVLGTWFLYRNDFSGLIIFSFALLGFCAFLYLMKKHNLVAYQRDHSQYMSQINTEEIARLQGKYYPQENGLSHAEPTHPYAIDLDIFGRSSLFTLLNRTTTIGGNTILARWLKEKSTFEEIHQRQQAIQDLSAQIEWRQHFQASGLHVKASIPDIIPCL
jgi:DNA mismatch repair ATPase MutS